MNSTEVTLRPVTDSDHPWMIDLAKRTVGSSVSSFRKPAEGAPERAIENLMNFGFKLGVEAALAESALERLAFIMWSYTIPDEITAEAQSFIMYLCVEPHVRRAGAAQFLLAHVEAESVRRGIPYIQCAVSEENSAVRELAALLGYQTERRIMCKRI